jgi:hypothetical protein
MKYYNEAMAGNKKKEWKMVVKEEHDERMLKHEVFENACLPQFQSGGHRASQSQYPPCFKDRDRDDPPAQESANS